MIRALLCALFLSGPAAAATIVVTVHGVRNDHGQVRVALCPAANFLQPTCPWFGSAQAHPGDVRVTVSHVPPGTYAAEAFHDENDNGKLERSFFGLPEEGMGFSNDAPMHFGPPKFDAAAFQVDAADKEIGFRLKYYN
jgi:uncharacterized protein (DUF2141 family)